jgi:DNA-binding MarR family transcriptional regulator
MPAKRPEEMSLLFDVWLVMHLASGYLDQALADTGLSGDDFGLYSLLRVFGPATPTQIATWTGMRPTTVSAALRRAASRGHTAQRRNPDDGRSYLVGLSAAGVKAHARAAGPFLDFLAEMHDALGPEVVDQRLSLQRLDGALRDAAGLPPRPYALEEQKGRRRTVAYDGQPLTTTQERAVRAYIDGLRAQAPSRA